MLFALAFRLSYSIVGGVKLTTVEAWSIWDLGQQLPSAIPVLRDARSLGNDKGCMICR